MEAKDKIKIYEEISEIKRHYQLEILNKMSLTINRVVKFDDDDPYPSEEIRKANRDGFNTASMWACDLLRTEIDRIERKL